MVTDLWESGKQGFVKILSSCGKASMDINTVTKPNMALNFGGNPDIRPECLGLGINIFNSECSVKSSYRTKSFPIHYKILLELT